EVQLIARLVDVRVDLILFASPRTRQARVSDDEEEDHAHVRNEEDGEKPGHRSRWASIAWNDDDRDDADGDVDECQERQDPPWPWNHSPHPRRIAFSSRRTRRLDSA